MRLTDQNGNIIIARTSAFGYYQFHDVQAGQTCIVTVASKRYTFTPRVVNVFDDLVEIDFVAEE